MHDLIRHAAVPLMLGASLAIGTAACAGHPASPCTQLEQQAKTTTAVFQAELPNSADPSALLSLEFSKLSQLHAQAKAHGCTGGYWSTSP